MSNFAALIEDLSIAGSRLTDGTPNASGVVYFFQPGTNTQVNVYSDAGAAAVVTQPITLGEGGKLPSELSAGVFATQPVRILIQDASGNTVTDSTYIPATAGDVGVSNIATTATTLDAWITQAQTSTGGTNLQYLESAGATSRPIQDKFREQGISVKDFGAVGDGINVDTTAIQSALSRAKVLSCNVIVPAGTYKVDQALTLTSATGVTVIGAGPGATIINQTNATANGFTLTSCTDCGVTGLTVTHATTSTGASIGLVTAATRPRITNVKTLHYAFGVSGTVASTSVTIDSCSLEGSTASIKLVAVVRGSITNTILSSPAGSGAGIGVNLDGICVNVYIGFCHFLSDIITGVSWTNAVGSSQFTVAACPTLGGITTGFSIAGASTDLALRQFGNGLDGEEQDVTSGSTVTPHRLKGVEAKIRGTTTGVAYVVAAPTPTPLSGFSPFGDLFLHLHNNAGGAITGWTMNAIYHTSAGPSTVNNEHTFYHFRWDPAATVWREVARSVTT